MVRLGFFFCFLWLFNSSVWAAGEIKSQSKVAQPAQPKFKASFDSFYYDFLGRHGADSGEYSFEGVSYSIQAMSLSYLISPMFQVGVTAQYVNNYAETVFFNQLYKDRAEGMGDTQVRATKTFLDTSGVYIADLALSLPTGSIGEKSPYFPGAGINYPYNMQLGSGTFDFYGTLIHVYAKSGHRLTSSATAVIRTGRNEYNYRRGNEYIAKVRYNYDLKSYFAPGIWMNFHHIQRLHGVDRTLGRPSILNLYHTPRNFWDLTPHVSGQYPVTKKLTLRGELGRPLWQESNNIDNVQVYNQWFAQLGLEGQF